MKNFEKNMAKLDEIVQKIEQNATLAESLALYKTGMALAAETAAALNSFEEEITILYQEDDADGT